MANRPQLQQTNKGSVHPSQLLMMAKPNTLPSSGSGVDYPLAVDSHGHDQELAILMQKHQLEMDQWIKEQINKLLQDFGQKKKQQMTSVFSKISIKYKEKMSQFRKASHLAIKLEAQLRAAIRDRDRWHRLADQNKFTIVDLKKALVNKYSESLFNCKQGSTVPKTKCR